MTEKKQRMQRHPMHLGGRRCASPQPPSSLFFKGCLLSLPHCFQEHHEEKTQEEEDKNDRKKTTHTKTPHANPPPAFFS